MGVCSDFLTLFTTSTTGDWYRLAGFRDRLLRRSSPGVSGAGTSRFLGVLFFGVSAAASSAGAAWLTVFGSTGFSLGVCFTVSFLGCVGEGSAFGLFVWAGAFGVVTAGVTWAGVVVAAEAAGVLEAVDAAGLVVVVTAGVDEAVAVVVDVGVVVAATEAAGVAGRAEVVAGVVVVGVGPGAGPEVVVVVVVGAWGIVAGVADFVSVGADSAGFGGCDGVAAGFTSDFDTGTPFTLGVDGVFDASTAGFDGSLGFCWFTSAGCGLDTGAEGGVGFTWEVTGAEAFVGAAGVVGLACRGGWLGFCVGNGVGLLGLSGTA